MAKNKHAYDIGDLVRVSREVCEARHHLPSGVVATVRGWGGWTGLAPGRVLVETPYGDVQSVSTKQLKLAKQAMRKRDEYAARR